MARAHALACQILSCASSLDAKVSHGSRSCSSNRSAGRGLDSAPLVGLTEPSRMQPILGNHCTLRITMAQRICYGVPARHCSPFCIRYMKLQPVWASGIWLARTSRRLEEPRQCSLQRMAHSESGAQTRPHARRPGVSQRHSGKTFDRVGLGTPGSCPVIRGACYNCKYERT